MAEWLIAIVMWGSGKIANKLFNNIFYEDNRQLRIQTEMLSELNRLRKEIKTLKDPESLPEFNLSESRSLNLQTAIDNNINFNSISPHKKITRTKDYIKIHFPSPLESIVYEEKSHIEMDGSFMIESYYPGFD